MASLDAHTVNEDTTRLESKFNNLQTHILVLSTAQVRAQLELCFLLQLLMPHSSGEKIRHRPQKSSTVRKRSWQLSDLSTLLP